MDPSQPTSTTSQPGCASNLGAALHDLRVVSLAAHDQWPLDDLLPGLLTQVRDLLDADSATLLLVDEEGSDLVVQASCGLAEDLIGEARVPVGAGVAGAIAARREPVVIDDLRTVERASEHLRTSDLRSLAGVPVVSGDVLLGVLHVGSRRPAAFRHEDLGLLALVSDWVAVAISRAALHQAEGAARATAEAALARLAFLAEASHILSRSLEVDVTLGALTRLVVPKLADCAILELVDEDGGLRPAGVTALDAEHQAMLAELQESPLFARDAEVGVPHVIRTGETVRYDDIRDALREVVADNPRWTAALDRVRTVDAVIVPLVARGRPLGALAVVRVDDERPFTDDDVDLLEDLGDRAGLAVDNARAYDAMRRAELRYREVATTLQASLLPPHLPRMPGTELAAVYHPAGTGGEVGGDFYDLFHTRGKGWGVVMGDVRGKGPQAAAVTALARYTLRTAAMSARRPSKVLTTLNEVMVAEDAEEMFCTIAYAAMTPQRDGRLRVTVSCGGHPMPLVLRVDGTVETLGRPGTMLGILDEVEVHDVRTSLAVGDALVLYTDGVTEARFRGAADDRVELFGDERLAAVLTGCRGLDAAAIASRLETSVLDFSAGRPRDDIAIVVVRVPPAGLADVGGAPPVTAAASATATTATTVARAWRRGTCMAS